MFARFSYRARRLIFVALWSARRRGGSYIEPEDLLHAIIREDRGEIAAIITEVFPGAAAPIEDSVGSHRPFFPGSVATDLLRELDEDTDPLNAETRSEKPEPMARGDMPMSRPLKNVLALVSKAHQHDLKTIEPLDLLAGIMENRDSRLAQLLRDHGITRQKVAQALDSGS
jgi:ATP-dependent Clp protease ATP-binding subunit ClpA